MDPTTELASNFTVARYQELRPSLTSSPQNEDAWREVINAMRRRIQERFLTPVKELARFDDEHELPYRPGFAILALDCLLIDTVQSFREGRVATGEVSPAHSFKAFLSGRRFSDFNGRDRNDFFHYVRNALLHNGETRSDWKVRIDTERMLELHSVTRTRTINRQVFHEAINQEVQDLFADLESRKVEPRRQFLRRMDAMAGFPVEALRHFYFAYGSNLKHQECHRTAPHAEGYGVAFLPGFRVVFAKHSSTRRCDAATINPDPRAMVWGFVYRVNDQDLKEIRKREGGYEEREITVYLTASIPEEDPTPLAAITFVAAEVCPHSCGPSVEYLDLIVQGAEERDLPRSYIETLHAARNLTTNPM